MEMGPPWGLFLTGLGELARQEAPELAVRPVAIVVLPTELGAKRCVFERHEREVGARVAAHSHPSIRP